MPLILGLVAAAVESCRRCIEGVVLRRKEVVDARTEVPEWIDRAQDRTAYLHGADIFAVSCPAKSRESESESRGKRGSRYATVRIIGCVS